MTPADLFPPLVETTVAASVAILLVLALRRALRHAFGAGIAYAAWALVPLAMLAVLLPAAQVPGLAVPAIAMQTEVAVLAGGPMPAASVDVARLLLIVAGFGTLASVLWMFVQQRRFMRALGRLAATGDGVFIAEAIEGLPAAVGLLRPRILLPADAMQRYDATERALMLAHERAHIARGDLVANALSAALRCVFWFNPLVHVAARRFRDDQEFACDAHVLQRHPHARRAYGEAMLKTQLARGVLPLGCHWARAHPLRERIEMLKQPLHSMRRRVLGRATALGLLLATGYVAWAAQPVQPSISTVPAGKIAADIALRVDDGEPVHLRAVVEAGVPFSVDARQGGKHYVLASSVERTQIDMKPVLRMQMRITEDGKVLTEPGIAVENGKSARIQVGEETADSAGRARFKGVRLDIVLTDSATQAVAVAPLAMPPPVYPVDVLEQGVNGTVVLIVDVAMDGSVSQVKVDRSAGDERLDAAALEAVRQWTFKPLVKDGHPVSSQVRVPVRFTVDGDHAAPLEQARAAVAGPAAGRVANRPDWTSYDRMVRSLRTGWDARPAPADAC